MTRLDLVSELADRIGRVQRSHSVRVAIDGVDAARKTTLADELVVALERSGRPVTAARAEIRDRELFGDAAKVRQRYEACYVPGQRLYLTEAQPERYASVVVDNNDPAHPRLERAV